MIIASVAMTTRAAAAPLDGLAGTQVPVRAVAGVGRASPSLPGGPLLSHKLYLPIIFQGGPGATSSAHIYWGALVNGQPPTTAAMQPGGVFDAFEARSGKKMSILHWGQAWQWNGTDQPFQTDYFNNTRNHGSIPLIDWGSWATADGPVQPQFALSTIYSGVHDGYIRQWALDAKAWGHPFFLRFDWEMNGNWQFPWSEQLNANLPGDYIRAWQHVHDIFAQSGATNVTWVWCPNISSSATLPLAGLYPGDAYVDWTCLDGYNKYDTWLGMNSIFTGSGINWLFDSYQAVLTVAPSKPVMIGETASVEAGDGGTKKANWIRDAFQTQLPVNLPMIKAVVWFNWDDNSSTYATLPIESSAASVQAFASTIGTSQYAANDFANLDTSPIAPLP